MIEVTCALIRNDEGFVLAVRRGPSMDNAGKWEFPGGKIRPGEDHEDCIIREIDEELGISIIITGRLDISEYDYGDKHIRLIPFICETLSSKPQLREHGEYRWLKPQELVMLDLTAADIPVALQYAASYGSNEGNSQSEAAEAISTVEAGDEMAKLMGRVSSVEEITMIAHSAVNDPVLLSQLVTLSSSHEKRVGFMASWGLSKVADINTAVLVPYLPALIDALPDAANESVQRSFMRVIMKCDVSQIPVSHHAKLIEYCLAAMRDTSVAVAPKAYGMEILASFCKFYPDMSNEVTAAIQMVISEASAGVKAMGRKALRRIKN
ncbi:MAG: (deoxy)nucleoside triphosphate pyrophosphohydrolase [Bacteroidales bacterium]|jgi:8-oxo-dGTP diphosphatase|nr:(deoxy)nucleoside triphosphate pyrophosphohydrolase [Bacteroidales bacterium]